MSVTTHTRGPTPSKGASRGKKDYDGFYKSCMTFPFTPTLLLSTFEMRLPEQIAKFYAGLQ